jgi:hypothetical protein
VKPCNAGGDRDPRGAYMQSTKQDAEVSHSYEPKKSIKVEL